jgi:hypothetical protein
MRFDIVFDIAEDASVAYGLVFVPSPVWVHGRRQLINLNPKSPAYHAVRSAHAGRGGCGEHRSSHQIGLRTATKGRNSRRKVRHPYDQERPIPRRHLEFRVIACDPPLADGFERLIDLAGRLPGLVQQLRCGRESIGHLPPW